MRARRALNLWKSINVNSLLVLNRQNMKWCILCNLVFIVTQRKNILFLLWLVEMLAYFKRCILFHFQFMQLFYSAQCRTCTFLLISCVLPGFCYFHNGCLKVFVIFSDNICLNLPQYFAIDLENFFFIWVVFAKRKSTMSSISTVEIWIIVSISFRFLNCNLTNIGLWNQRLLIVWYGHNQQSLEKHYWIWGWGKCNFGIIKVSCLDVKNGEEINMVTNNKVNIHDRHLLSRFHDKEWFWSS